MSHHERQPSTSTVHPSVVRIDVAPTGIHAVKGEPDVEENSDEFVDLHLSKPPPPHQYKLCVMHTPFESSIVDSKVGAIVKTRAEWNQLFAHLIDATMTYLNQQLDTHGRLHAATTEGKHAQQMRAYIDSTTDILHAIMLVRNAAAASKDPHFLLNVRFPMEPSAQHLLGFQLFIEHWSELYTAGQCLDICIWLVAIRPHVDRLRQSVVDSILALFTAAHTHRRLAGFQAIV